ncbi:bifunctional (p)ppGpp synthetase/guanosine-3',5'-bis(diphosphate) 3'-pyrophosphohydrolase [Thermoactinomyces vulgaris]|uniref:RelA/SpoT family protein n=1 Tax=Thermoactinomyces vulgaris TaxID=2026 RepID=UPI000673AA53|nr:bifunctional (p)ppGpp synthetase/guanosine-3',5'-bis(diphosphate) 3'-pyrophosphohydrolase [Thermoactinomyces vulgaris]QBK13577.1 bifunctional (p)ppGpp synthetase/guanosine-3',5'-bis(diphosphate) 3'-pyrophosphohydrolase [Thermoactinomyces vulgaris]
MPIDALVDIAESYLSKEDVMCLKAAYEFAAKAHEGQTRKSGEPYIHHPVEVAIILAELKMDLTTLIAALLHDVVEDTSVTLEEVEEKFGPAVGKLVDGLTKLRKRMKFKSNQEHQAENHRKMFVAMAKDIRVILIKLADRLHNMRTLKYMPEKKQREKSRETLEIYAPLAHRLGISKIKWELEDTALRYLNPQQYYRIVHLMKKKRAEREQYLDEIISTLSERLEGSDVPVLDISGRPKHIYSIYRKMVTQNKEFNEIYDLMAVRVIVNTVRDCYTVLGIIHTIWKPMPGRFKDYIAMPKANMYQSLHTTVIGPKGEPIEVQIRTMKMHRTAEYGIAAHWAYKEGSTIENSKFEEKLKWFREMMELQQETKDALEFVESLKVDWFSDSVFVFTPKGDVIELPQGSVPLDFAYRIHTDIGNMCIGAKVNGKIVPLDYQLHTGDIVEILTSKHSYGPSQDWLKIVKSSNARNKIRSWFKKQRREESIVKGREMVEALLKKHDFKVSEVLTNERIQEVTRKFNFQDPDDLFAAVGYGGITTAQVVNRLTDGLKEEEQPVILPDVKTMRHRNHKADQGVRVKGVDNLLIRLSRCCNPVPGDDIAGYVTQGRGVTVHRADCPNLNNVPKERRIEVEWDSQTSQHYQVDIEVSGFDRQGLLNEVLQVISDTQTSLSAVSAKGDRRGIASIHIRVGIQNINHLKSVVERVKGVRDIYSVRRIIQ